MEEYASLPDDMVGAAKRWQEWMELERPEDEPLPGTLPDHVLSATLDIINVPNSSFSLFHCIAAPFLPSLIQVYIW